MRVLYLSYWPAEDPLTTAIILPRLTILAKNSGIDAIDFISIERESEATPIILEKVVHTPFKSVPSSFLLITKLRDFIGLIRLIILLVKKGKVKSVICNSTLAGSIGYIAGFFCSFDLIVECFEPHADYMRESGVWRAWGIRYNLLKFLEWRQQKTATKLLTVSDHYSNHLLNSGVPKEKILMTPNGVNIDQFKFNPIKREEVRLQFKIPKDHIVGIYVGKFGGIYYHDQAFDLFAQAFVYFGEKFHLIILTAHSSDEIGNELKKRGVDATKVSLLFAASSEVPDFLSSADFAFATIKPAPIRKYCCPIKVGEYWANGLPVLLEPGIGDDSDTIAAEGGGVILDMENPSIAFGGIKKMMEQGRSVLASEIADIAIHHRDFTLVEKAYSQIFARF